MTEKNRAKQERKERRQNTGKMWTGYKSLVTKTKREKELSLRKKYKPVYDIQKGGKTDGCEKTDRGFGKEQGQGKRQDRTENDRVD